MARGVKVEMMSKKVFTRISRSETRLKGLQAASLTNPLFDKKKPTFKVQINLDLKNCDWKENLNLGKIVPKQRLGKKLPWDPIK